MLHNKLITIERNMPVVDPNDNEIGEVKLIMFGDNNLSGDDADVPDTAYAPIGYAPKWVSEFVSAMSIDTDIPEDFEMRLRREGFIKVYQGGFDPKEYFVTRNQIRTVTDDKVVINTTADSLVEV